MISTLKHFAAHGIPEGGHNAAPVAHGKAGVVRVPPQAVLSRGEGRGTFRDVGLQRYRRRALHRKPPPAHRYPAHGSGDSKALWCRTRPRWSRCTAPSGSPPTRRKRPRLALHAGVDLDLWDDAYGDKLAEAVERGLIAEAEIDQAVLRDSATEVRDGAVRESLRERRRPREHARLPRTSRSRTRNGPAVADPAGEQWRAAPPQRAVRSPSLVPTPTRR